MAVQWAEDVQLAGLERGSFYGSGAVSWDEFIPASRNQGTRVRIMRSMYSMMRTPLDFNLVISARVRVCSSFKFEGTNGIAWISVAADGCSIHFDVGLLLA
jgi:hypothetical protein